MVPVTGTGSWTAPNVARPNGSPTRRRISGAMTWRYMVSPSVSRFRRHFEVVVHLVDARDAACPEPGQRLVALGVHDARQHYGAVVDENVNRVIADGVVAVKGCVQQMRAAERAFAEPGTASAEASATSTEATAPIAEAG